MRQDVSLKRSRDQSPDSEVIFSLLGIIAKIPAEGKAVNTKPQIIKRRAAPPKTTVRAHQRDELSLGHADDAKSQDTRTASPSLPPQNELAEIQALLRPPDSPGLSDWGIPPPSTGACDTALEVGPKASKLDAVLK